MIHNLYRGVWDLGINEWTWKEIGRPLWRTKLSGLRSAPKWNSSMYIDRCWGTIKEHAWLLSSFSSSTFLSRTSSVTLHWVCTLFLVQIVSPGFMTQKLYGWKLFLSISIMQGSAWPGPGNRKRSKWRPEPGRQNCKTKSRARNYFRPGTQRGIKYDCIKTKINSNRKPTNYFNP